MCVWLMSVPGCIYLLLRDYSIFWSIKYAVAVSFKSFEQSKKKKSIHCEHKYMYIYIVFLEYMKCTILTISKHKVSAWKWNYVCHVHTHSEFIMLFSIRNQSGLKKKWDYRVMRAIYMLNPLLFSCCRFLDDLFSNYNS